MIKDTFFSPARFLRVCKRDILENWKSNILRFTVLYGAMAIISFWIYYVKYRQGDFSAKDSGIMMVSFIVFSVLGCVYASGVMEGMTTKEKRIAYLMLPATSFEKYLSRLVYSLVIYVFAFALAFKLADYTRMAVLSFFFPLDSIHPTMVHFYELWKGGSGFVTEHGTFSFFICLYLAIHSLFVLGGSIWYKKPFLKTIVALMVMLIIYAQIVGRVIDWQLSGKMLDFLGFDASNMIALMNASTLLFLAVALFNWTLAYFRFKEAEVIDRIF